MILGIAALALAMETITHAQPATDSPPATVATDQVPNLLDTNPPTITKGLGIIYQAIASSGVLSATNYSIEPYATYAPKLPTKIGGGLLCVYNVNEYVGLGLGFDWLGSFNIISANASLKYPMHPLKSVTFLPERFRTDFAVVPFTLFGGGTSFNGNSGVMIADTGFYTSFGHLWGGQFNTGVAWGQWANAGDYSGKRYHIFAGWSKGF